jgi:hypothetical protein
VSGEKILERPLSLKLSEFFAHLPITIVASILAYIGLKSLASSPDYTPNFLKYFHIFVYLHFFMSSATTTAIYFKHTNRILKAIIVGITGSAIFCSVSDIILPYVGVYLLGLKIKFHFCILEDIAVVFIGCGAFFGFLLFRFFLFITYVTHPLHILTSVLASFFYLVSFGSFELGASSLIIVILAVLLPCTFSDFVYPMLFVHKSCCLKKYT